MSREIIKAMMSISSKLARIPFEILFISYFLMIIIFAFLYSLPIAKFYHSTVAYEEEVDNEAQVISLLLKEKIIENNMFFNGNEFKYENWTMNGNDLSLYITGEDDKYIFANVFVNIFNEIQRDDNSTANIQFGGNYKIKIGLYEDRLRIDNDVYLPVIFENNRLLGIDNNKFDLNLFHYI